MPFKYSPIERVKFSDPDLEEKLAKYDPLLLHLASSASLSQTYTPLPHSPPLPDLRPSSLPAESFDAVVLHRGQPLVMTDCAITAELAKRWTVDYLASHIEPDFSCSVFHSKNNIFQYQPPHHQTPTTKVTS